MGKTIKRRWFQFTLRSALFLATAFCLALGWWANSAHQQRLAVQQIRSLSGWAEYDRRLDETHVPKWLCELVGDDFFVNVNQVTLTHRKDGKRDQALTPDELDQLVAAMQRLPKLRRLTLSHTGLRDEDLSRLAPLLNRIEYIGIFSYTKEINGQCIAHFRDWPRLKSLYFLCSQLDPHALDQLSALPSLENLNWSHCKLDAEAFAHIARCQRLRRLGLYKNRFDGESLLELKAAPKLQELRLQNICATVNDRSWLGKEDEAPPKKLRFSAQSGMGVPLELEVGPQVDAKKWIEQRLPGVRVGEIGSS